VKRALLLAVLAAVAGGCSGSPSPEGSASAAARPASCPAGWKALAARIHAPVYCPTWMPDPLGGVIGSRWNNIHSVDRDRSYLVGFVWQEVQSGELHVNLRGYPGRTAIPKCPGEVRGETVPCFADPTFHRRAPGIQATAYTVNQGADQWHLLYAWRHAGSLYTLSMHVARPLTFRKVVQNMDRMLRSLRLVRPGV
jgi:hypothetical protein